MMLPAFLLPFHPYVSFSSKTTESLDFSSFLLSLFAFFPSLFVSPPFLSSSSLVWLIYLVMKIHLYYS